MATRRLVSALTVLSLSAWRGCAAGTFDMGRSDNIAVYWGQTTSKLSDLCKNPDVNIIPIAFMTSAKGQGAINVAGNCVAGNLPGSDLWDCTALEQDIKDCQDAGKIVTLSVGGAGQNITFSSEDEARQSAESLYNNFLGGDGKTRPFGGAILDGIDMDIEIPNATYLAAFVNHTLDFAKKDGKKYYVTGAPQCPYTDDNMDLDGDAVVNLLRNAPFDALFVQFYNNDCGLKSNADLSKFNYFDWAEWARGGSINQNVKIYVGAPGSPSAAGTGYVDSETLGKYIDAVKKNGTASAFGGVMIWDAGTVAGNTAEPDFLHNVKKAIASSGGSSGMPSGSASTPASSATDASATATSGTGDSSATATAASGSASAPASTAIDGTSAAEGSATPTSGTADGPAATASGADGSQTASQTSTPTGSPGDGDDDSDDSDCDDEDEDGDETSQAARPTATTTSACTPAPSDCAGVPDWQKTQSYKACENARYNGKLYQASSWVTSNEPGTIDVWKLVGTCPGSSAGSTLDSSAGSSSTVSSTESAATSVTDSLPAASTDSLSASPTDSLSASPTDSLPASSTDSSTIPSTQSSTLLASDSSALSSTGSASASATEASTTSSAGSSLTSSQTVVSSVQPERRLFGMRARHAA